MDGDSIKARPHSRSRFFYIISITMRNLSWKINISKDHFHAIFCNLQLVTTNDWYLSYVLDTLVLGLLYIEGRVGMLILSFRGVEIKGLVSFRVCVKGWSGSDLILSYRAMYGKIESKLDHPLFLALPRFKDINIHVNLRKLKKQVIPSCKYRTFSK